MNTIQICKETAKHELYGNSRGVKEKSKRIQYIKITWQVLNFQ